MKKIAFTLIAIVAFGFASMSFVNSEDNSVESILSNDPVTIPANVKEVIDNKCYGCHNSESKNKKGKKKLSFDKLGDLSVYKQIGKYEGIHEVLTEGEMPPEKFLAKYPNKNLTAKEKEILLNWSKSQGEELAK